MFTISTVIVPVVFNKSNPLLLLLFIFIISHFEICLIKLLFVCVLGKIPVYCAVLCGKLVPM